MTNDRISQIVQAVNEMVQDAVTATSAAASTVDQFARDADQVGLTDLLSMWADLDGSKGYVKRIEKALESLSKAKTALGKIVADRMVAEEVTSMKVKGKTVYLHTRLAASIIPEKKEKAIELLQQLATGLVKPSVNQNSLTSWLKNESERDPLAPVEDPSNIIAQFPELDEEIAECLRVVEIITPRVRG